jgi:hypothetical protein
MGRAEVHKMKQDLSCALDILTEVSKISGTRNFASKNCALCVNVHKLCRCVKPCICLAMIEAYKSS